MFPMASNAERVCICMEQHHNYDAHDDVLAMWAMRLWVKDAVLAESWFPTIPPS